MADFDLEQLKTLFQNLGDRLSNSKGDESIVEKLTLVEKTIAKLNKHMERQKVDGKENDDKLAKNISKEFVSEWQRVDPMKDVVNAIKDSSGNTQGGLNLDPMGIAKNAVPFKAKMGALIQGFGQVAGASSKFGQALLGATKTLDGSLSGVATSLGINDGLFFAMAKMLDENIDAYRSLKNSAEGSIGSINDLRRAMSVASMNADEFAAAIANGTDGTRLLGGQNWANLYKGIKDQTKQFGYYGYTLEGITKAQNEYLGILADRGDIFGKDQKELVAGLDSILKVSGTTATILGKNREETLAAIKAQSLDANFATWMKGSDLTDPQKNEMQAIMAVLEQLGPDVANAAKDMIMSGGAISSAETAAAFAQLGASTQQTISSLAYSLNQGNVNEGDLKNISNNLRDAVVNDNKTRDNRTMGILGRWGAMGTEAANQFMLRGENLKPITEDTKLPHEITDQATQGLLSLQGTIKDMSSAINDSVSTILVPALDQFGGALKTATGDLGEMVNGLRDLISSSGKFDNSLMTSTGILAGGLFVSTAAGLLGTSFAKALRPLASGMLKSLGLATRGLSKASTSLAAGLANAKIGDTVKAAMATGGKAAQGVAKGAKAGAKGVAYGAGAATEAYNIGTKALQGTAVRGLTKALGPLATVIEGISTYGDISDAWDRKEAGEITNEEFKKIMTEQIGGALGGVGGALLGAKIMAALGAAGGTMVVPGGGTLVGGVVGGIGGAIGGGFAGDAMGEQIGGLLYDYVLSEDEESTAEPITPATVEPIEVPVVDETSRDTLGVSSDKMYLEAQTTNLLLKNIGQILITSSDVLKEMLATNASGFDNVVKSSDDIARKIRLNNL